MRILSIKFEKHPILGDLELNFTNQKGNPVDTVIIAGENGCGKTTILEELENLWKWNRPTLNSKFGFVTSKIILNDIELDDFIKKSPSINLIKPTGVFEIRQDLSICDYNCFNFKYQSMQNLNDYRELQGGFVINLQPLRKTIFSTVDINYRADDINVVTASDLDTDESLIKRSTADIATKINQLLIDINSSDGDDLQNWVGQNEGKVPPRELCSPRIKRFSNAFATMFKDLTFSRVCNFNGHKMIFFKRGNTEIPISQLSSGEKQVVYRGAFFLKDIELNKGRLVFIDEPEISMHPEWQKKILNYYQKLFTDNNGKQLSQIFVATHSPFIIHNPMRHDDKVIVLQREKDGSIKCSDKPAYYNCASCVAVEDGFSVFDFKTTSSLVVLLEGQTDEMYFNKAKDLFGHGNLQYELTWIGRKTKNGCEEFTGQSSLDKAKMFILANPYLVPYKVILLYDCDTNKTNEVCSAKLRIKTLPKMENPRYKKGIENLLNLPTDFSYDDYYIETCNDYGCRIQSLDKMKLAKYVCDECTEEQQKSILQNLEKELLDIESMIALSW